jgi:hypothetical protein
VGSWSLHVQRAALKERIEGYKEKLDPGSPEEVRTRISELENKLETFTSDPRLFKADQLDRMAHALKQHKPGAVIVSRGGSSLECGGVQKQIRLFFKRQGWTVRHWETFDNPDTDLGLTLFTHTGDEVTDSETAVRSALDAAGIPYNCERQVPSDDRHRSWCSPISTDRMALQSVEGLGVFGVRP